ncbi:hypothetical protein BOX15_Mlig005727g1 [Macrostomum lignano]|uniref:Fibrinogen C-terminal domain-containing protein n=1 Tax=Macrostomum lignano TaxID=282301 RepID=A0A267EW76_9PLAT|nr:hypothetical protein BOX15_Mlig005727g1 [Macrostomum lignano]
MFNIRRIYTPNSFSEDRSDYKIINSGIQAMQKRCVLLFLVLCVSLVPYASAAEFQVNFLKKPPSIMYNLFYEKYELDLDLQITEVASQSPDGKRKVTGLKVIPENGMQKQDFGATVLARVSSDGTSGKLVFVCRTLHRCMSIRKKISDHPLFIQQAVQFAPFGTQGPIPTQFGAVRSASGPAPVPAEVVFQRHLDNSLSFAQNWHGYVKGFGDPSGNYWMGLEQLLAMTKDRHCQLIYEGVRIDNGKLMRGTFKRFGLHGADENYKLVLEDQEPGGDLWKGTAEYFNAMQFSTFDADNDKYKGECTKEQGHNAGWWYKDCHRLNPNSWITTSPSFCWNWCSAVDVNKIDICIKSTKLSFSCS